MRRIRVPPRVGWEAQAESLGFRFHTIDGAAYWDETAYYAFTLDQIERDIEDPTQALHEMAMALVDEVVANEALLTQLSIPQSMWDWIASSWRARDPHLYGRMDLPYDGTGPAKLYELNYDTPTSLYESAYFQWRWLEDRIADGTLPAWADQYNRIQEALCETLAGLARGGLVASPMHFAVVAASDEDRGTVAYLRDCAQQAGLDTIELDMADIGTTLDGRLTDLDDRIITTLFKLYPLEWLFAERDAAQLPHAQLRMIEPPWKAILSNKGVLPLLWQRHANHPNLLPAFFENADERAAALPHGWVRKPLLSREGANIELVDAHGVRLASDGPYDTAPTIRQAYHPLPDFDGNHPLIGSWVVADTAVGMGLREDRSLITQNTSRFVPHVILSA